MMYRVKRTILIIVSTVLFFTLDANAKIDNWSNLTQKQYTDNLVECKTTLDELKWSYNIWPNQNKTAKPLFADVMDVDKIRQFVSNNLKMQAILSDRFNFEITPAMLQYDLDRMARNTKDAKRLKKVFAVLGNNPNTIAECVSRPYLVQKQLINQYNYNNDIHAGVKLTAQTDLDKYLNSNNTEDTTAEVYTIIYTLKGDEEDNLEDKMPAEPTEEISIELDKEDFEQKLKQLNNQKLQQQTTAFIYTEIIEQTQQRIKVQVLQWQKQSQNTWVSNQADNKYLPTPQYSKYSLPTITGTGQGFDNKTITGDTWESKFYAADGRESHTAIWSGSEMIVWGGWDGGNRLNSGGRYNPVNDSWLTTSTGANVPTGRYIHTAIWNGTEMIIWGGYAGVYLNTGGRYNPSSDSWLSTSTGANVPTGRYYHTAIWGDGEMIIWGGSIYSGGIVYLNTGGRYDPSSNSWLSISTGANSPTARRDHTAIWGNNEMIIWGGSDGSYLNTGARYDSSGNSWIATSIGANVPAVRQHHTAIWSGNEMIIWGGFGAGYLKTGGRYDPSDDSWTATDAGANTPSGRYHHTAIWSGSEMIIWGGVGYMTTGGRYDPVNNSWISTSGTNVPTGRYFHTAIWSDNEMIVWGGRNGGYLNTGGRYNPVNDSWISTSAGVNVPIARRDHTAIWSGSEMIIWGGYGESSLNTGGRYDPASDSWLTTSTGTDVPAARYYHTAIWSGAEMIIWGGNNLNTGSRYDPSDDSWVSTSTGANIPMGRSYHTAIWSGTEMIIWGGYNGGYLNTGGRYDPFNNIWLSTNTVSVDAPTSRFQHTAIWKDSEMIIWGGYNGAYLNTGSRYDPDSDSWLSTSIGANVPTVRSSHTAIWSGSEMVVWGGVAGSYLNTGGRYNPTNDSWSSTGTGVNLPTGRRQHTAIWSGSEMVVWGGYNGGHLDTGGRYNPSSNTWSTTSTTSAPIGRRYHTAIWTGSEMLVWAGYFGASTNSMGIYYPSSTYTISGNLNGLNGNQVIIQNNAGDDLTLTTDGAFTFDTDIVEGSNYVITVLTEPTSPAQTCTITNGDGLNVSANINNIEINCVNNSFDVGVTVTGLAAGNLVKVKNNGIDLMDVSNNNILQNFTTQVDNGSDYLITFDTQPTTPNQICRIATNDETGTVSGADVNVTITCVNIYNINVTVTGLALGNTIDVTNGAVTETLSDITTQTSFNLDDETAYSVSTTNPTTPNQECSITGGTNLDGSGVLAGNDVAITITCTIIKYNVNVTVTGLAATNSISFANGGDTSTFNGNTTQNISILDDESAFAVSITMPQPDTPNQVCSFTNSNSGTLSDTDVAITVTCVTTKYGVNVTVTGLASGNTIDVTNGAVTDTLSDVLTQTSFNLDDETMYAVSNTNPTTPNQVCSITGGTNNDGSGVLAGNDVEITITCTTNQYLIGGSVVGLQSGNSVVLDINSGAETLTVNSNAFVFVNPLTDGASYAVIVSTDPTSPSQTCSVSNGTGIISGADIDDIVITCTDDTFFIGGTVTGMHPGYPNTMVLQNNNQDNLTIHGDGVFVFVTPLLDLQDYNVTVQSQPDSPIQPCTVVAGVETLTGDDIDNVQVNCEFGDDLIFRDGFE